jgi:hypothetical protein
MFGVCSEKGGHSFVRGVFESGEQKACVSPRCEGLLIGLKGLLKAFAKARLELGFRDIP